MKLLIDIQDNKADFLKELLSSLPFVKNTTRVSAKEAATLTELKHIHKAYKLADEVKTGKVKTRPISELFNEL